MGLDYLLVLHRLCSQFEFWISLFLTLFLKWLYRFFIAWKGRLGIPNRFNNANGSLWFIESIFLIRSANTTQDFKLCSVRICNKDRREKEPSGQPMFRDAPNWILVFITIDLRLETTSSKLMPLKLLGFKESPFL